MCRCFAGIAEKARTSSSSTKSAFTTTACRSSINTPSPPRRALRSSSKQTWKNLLALQGRVGRSGFREVTAEKGVLLKNSLKSNRPFNGFCPESSSIPGSFFVHGRKGYRLVQREGRVLHRFRSRFSDMAFCNFSGGLQEGKDSGKNG